VTVVQNGEQTRLNLCDEHYAELIGDRGLSISPLESLFRGGLFERVFGDSWSLFDERDDASNRQLGRGAAPGDSGAPDTGAGTAGVGTGAGEIGGARAGSGPNPQGSQGPQGPQGPTRRAMRGHSREAVDLRSFLSQPALDTLQKAAEKAAEYGKRDVDTEHLLHAIADNDVVTAILHEFKLSPDELKRQIDENAPHGSEKLGADTQMGVSPRAKSALERALVASRELGHSYVGPEHFLIGLADEEDGYAGELLRRYGLTPQALRQKAVKVVGRGAEEGKVQAKSGTPHLDKYVRDLTELARQGKLDPVIGRAQEIETTIEVLARRKKNNPVLIGEPGVGKTAIVEGLAQRIVHDRVPEVLRGKRLVELNVNSMVAGAKYRGEFEERVQQVLEEIVERQNELIVFIDELHTIVGAGQGGGEGGLDIANTFKPALARGDLHLIGATTLNEYQKYIEKDAALERRFQPVLVPEPSVDETEEILRGLRDRLEAHHKVKITEAAIEAAAKLSDRYIAARFLPDKAIDLIDQAAARVRIAASARPAKLTDVERELRKLRQERDAASAAKNFDKAKDLEERLAEQTRKHAEATDEWKKAHGTGTAEVTPQDVAQIVSSLTGVPVTDLTSEDRDRLLRLEDELRQRVVGQDEAIHAVAEAVRLARAGLGEPNKPTATFLFLGSTGVGKTELAKALAASLFGAESALIRIDMSEYAERHTVSRLIGAPPGYVGYEEGGQLTERVRRRPYSVVLLDELEKAHPDAHNILLQLFDEGRLTDGKGRTVDFTNTIIIATSNVGSDIIQRNVRAPENERLDYASLRDKLMDVLRLHFRPEFLNRLDDIVVFRALGKEQIRAIVDLQLQRVAESALTSHDIHIEWEPALVEHLAEIGYDEEFGARLLKRRIRGEVESKLATAILAGDVRPGSQTHIGYDEVDKSVKIQPLQEAHKAAA
jgi:ATP-dependent Clp protease ATP-binding subunit ClpC